MTTQERLREAAKYLRTQYPRPFSCGQFIDELMVQGADEMDNWIRLLASAAQGDPQGREVSAYTAGYIDGDTGCRHRFTGALGVSCGEGDPGEP